MHRKRFISSLQLTVYGCFVNLCSSGLFWKQNLHIFVLNYHDTFNLFSFSNICQYLVGWHFLGISIRVSLKGVRKTYVSQYRTVSERHCVVVDGHLTQGAIPHNVFIPRAFRSVGSSFCISNSKNTSPLGLCLISSKMSIVSFPEG